MNFKKKLKRKEKELHNKKLKSTHSRDRLNTFNHCIAQDSIKFILEKLFYLVEVSQFDFSDEETSCENEINARKKLD